MIRSDDPVLDADWYYTQAEAQAEKLAREHVCGDCVHCIKSDYEDLGWCKVGGDFVNPTYTIEEGCIQMYSWEVRL